MVDLAKWLPACGLVLCLLVVQRILGRIVGFYKNYRLAQTLGFPMVLSPISQDSVFWGILRPYIAPILAKAPFGLGTWAAYTAPYSHWLWEDRDGMHLKYGKSVIHVSPRKAEIYTADLTAARDIFARRRDWERENGDIAATLPYLMRHSVSTVHGPDWQRQRRITAAPFNESNMRRVWQHSLRQARDATRWWSSHQEKGAKTISHDTENIALNVLGAAGLGVDWRFAPEGKIPDGEDPFATIYKTALTYLLNNMTRMVLTPIWLSEHLADYPKVLRLLPKSTRDYFLNVRTFQDMMRKLMKERTAQLETGEAKVDVFLNAVLAKGIEGDGLTADGKRDNSVLSGGLTAAEVSGNIFTFNVAGHETTAHLLSYTFYRMSIEPQWQQWIQEEVDHVFPAADLPLNLDMLDYEATFPRLKRCLALMYEMLRLYPAVLETVKDALGPKGQAQELALEDRTVLIPNGMRVHIRAYSVSIMSEYWGPDSYEWRPNRWMEKSKGNDSKSKTLAQTLEEEAIVPPQICKEAYQPWALGARDCPGKKLSMVEFVAMMAYTLRHYNLTPVLLEGENAADARKRIEDYMQDSDHRITLNFREPDKYPIQFMKRA